MKKLFTCTLNFSILLKRCIIYMLHSLHQINAQPQNKKKYVISVRMQQIANVRSEF